jgi:hypothetical protein
VDNIIASLKITDVQDGVGARAKFQRKITAECSALSPSFPVANISLSRDIYDGEIITGTEYTCELRATSLKDTGKDPEKTWNYWWEIVRWGVEDSAPPPPTASAKTPFDSNSSQRYTQYCTNARTALMQAIQVHTVDGAYIQKEMSETFAVADEILGWLNNVTFTSSPNSGHLAVDAVNNGAVPTDIKDTGAILNGWKIPDFIERVGSQIADSLADALFEAFESRNTNQTRNVANRARETAPQPQSNKRNGGGIAI